MLPWGNGELNYPLAPAVYANLTLSEATSLHNCEGMFTRNH